MTQRTLHPRQAMIAGAVFALFMTVLNVVQSPGNRLTAFGLTVGFCALLGVVVYLVLRALTNDRRQRPN